MLIKMVGRIEIEYKNKKIYRKNPKIISKFKEIIERNKMKYRDYSIEGIPGIVMFLKEKKWIINEKIFSSEEVAKFIDEKYNLVEKEVKEIINKIMNEFGDSFSDYFEVYSYIDIDYDDVDYDYLFEKLFPIFDKMYKNEV